MINAAVEHATPGGFAPFSPISRVPFSAGGDFRGVMANAINTLVTSETIQVFHSSNTRKKNTGFVFDHSTN